MVRRALRERGQAARQGDSDGVDQPEEGAPSGAADGQARRAVAVGVQQPGLPPRLRAAAGDDPLLPPAAPRRRARAASPPPLRQRRRRRIGGGSEAAGGAAVPQGEFVQLPRARVLGLRSLRELPRPSARRGAGRRAEQLQRREPECLLHHVIDRLSDGVQQHSD
jgi:hypothetical protein